MAQTVTLPVKNADFSQSGANWPTNFCSFSSNRALIGSQANAFIYQLIDHQFKAGYLYTLSFDSTRTSGSGDFSTRIQLYYGNSIGENDLQQSVIRGPNGRRHYFFYSASGATQNGQKMTIRIGGAAEVEQSVDNVTLTESRVVLAKNYGGSTLMTGSATFTFPTPNHNSHFYSKVGNSLTSCSSSTEMSESITTVADKTYKIHCIIPGDGTSRKQDIAINDRSIITGAVPRNDRLLYLSADVPFSETSENNQFTVKVINQVTSNATMGEMYITDEGPTPILSPGKIQEPGNSQSLPGKKSFTAKWTASATPDIDHYLLYVSDQSDFSTTITGTNGEDYNGLNVGNVTEYDVTGVDDSKDLYFRLVAVKGTLESHFSETNTVPTAVITPAYGVEVAKVGAELKWTVDFEDAVVSYNVEQHIKGIWTKVTTVAAKGEPNSNYSVVVGDGEFRITAVDSSGFSQSFATESTKEVFINLTKGWNLISIPFEGADLTALEADRTLWTWNGTAYEKAEKVNALQGLWVFSPAATQLTLTGTKVADATVALSTGWNLVGPAENCKVPAGLKVFSWETTYQQILDASASLIQGHGYWMFADKKTTVKLGL